MLCYASNAYVIFFLDGVGISATTLAWLWQRRFALDFAVLLMVWLISLMTAH